MVKLIMMVGLPGSGKTSLCHQLMKKYSLVFLSSDELRVEWYGSMEEEGNRVELFRELYARAKRAVADGQSVVIDATNGFATMRKELLQSVQQIDKYCYYLKTPLHECMRRNAARNRVVDPHIITAISRTLEEPTYHEGWTKIHLIDYSDKTAST